MSDDRARPVAAVESGAVPAAHATTFRPQDHSKPTPHDAPAADHDAAKRAAPTTPPHRATELAFQVDAESQRLIVQVVDRETQNVLRSYLVQLPGASGAPEPVTAPLGALIDEKV